MLFSVPYNICFLMKIFKNYRFFTVLGLLALLACGPVYGTKYHYAPPQKDSGRMCVNSCLSEKAYCEQDCYARQKACEHEAEDRADYEYAEYVHTQKKNKHDIKRERSSFVQYCSEEDSCKQSCEKNHNICYVNCGGVINESRECTAFCDE